MNTKLMIAAVGVGLFAGGCATAPPTPQAAKAEQLIEECNKRLPVKITQYRVGPDGTIRVSILPGMEWRFNECLREHGRAGLNMFRDKPR